MKHYDKSKWKLCLIADCLDYEQPGKYIIHTDIIPMLRNIPVLTANKSFIIGYTEESDNIYDKGAVIIYDDFTMDMKYVDFAFKVKSSAIKLLTAKPGYNLYFIYSLLKQMNLSQQEHARSYISKVGRMYIPIPDLDEQTKIADQLSKTDEHISNLEALISKQEAIKKTTLKMLLTPQSNWIHTNIGSLVTVLRGESLQSKNFVSGNIPVVAGGVGVAGYHNKSNRPVNTITISASGANAGFINFYKKPIFATDCSTISETNSLDTLFLYYVLKSKQDSIFKMQTGGAQPHVHPKDISRINIFIPNLDEQQRIATQLSEIDAHIENLKQQLAKQRAIKQGLMDYFFGN